VKGWKLFDTLTPLIVWVSYARFVLVGMKHIASSDTWTRR